jgi:hypothetical protein
MFPPLNYWCSLTRNQIYLYLSTLILSFFWAKSYLSISISILIINGENFILFFSSTPFIIAQQPAHPLVSPRLSPSYYARHRPAVPRQSHGRAQESVATLSSRRPSPFALPSSLNTRSCRTPWCQQGHRRRRVHSMAVLCTARRSTDTPLRVISREATHTCLGPKKLPRR